MSQVNQTMAQIGTTAQHRARINQIWHVIVTQLGTWNTERIAAIDKYEFSNLSKEAQVAVLNEFS